MKHLKLITVSILLFAAVFPSAAQEECRRDATGLFSSRPSFRAYATLQYTLDKDVNSFSIRRIRFLMRGDIVPQLGYTAQLDLSQKFAPVDLYTEYRPSRAFRLRIGQFKVPFSLENRYATLSYEGIYSSQFISQTMTDKGGRDIGIAASGSLLPNDYADSALIDYWVGIFNGAGINTLDNDRTKDVAARININLSNNFLISASAYHSLTHKDSNPQRTVFAVGAKFTNAPLLIRGEWFEGQVNHNDLRSCYALIGFRPIDRMLPYVKYDYANDSITARTDYVAGIDYWAFDSLRIQLYYAYRCSNPSTGIGRPWVTTPEQRQSLFSAGVTFVM